MKSNHTKLLYISDNVSNVKSFVSKFEKLFKIESTGTLIDAISILERKSIHVVITDTKNGLHILSEIGKQFPEAQRIFISGERIIGEVIDALNNSEIFAYISKEWSDDRYKDIILRANERYLNLQKDKEINFRLQRTNEQLEFMLREKLVS